MGRPVQGEHDGRRVHWFRGARVQDRDVWIEAPSRTTRGARRPRAPRWREEATKTCCSILARRPVRTPNGLDREAAPSTRSISENRDVVVGIEVSRPRRPPRPESASPSWYWSQARCRLGLITSLHPEGAAGPTTRASFLWLFSSVAMVLCAGKAAAASIVLGVVEANTDADHAALRVARTTRACRRRRAILEPGSVVPARAGRPCDWYILPHIAGG